MREIYTEIEINAAPTSVWMVLMKFEDYPTWNPFIQSLEGAAEVGEKLVAKLGLNKPMTIKPVIQEIMPNSLFSWKGKLFIRGIFDGKHIFELKKSVNGTKFIHKEEFTGILSWLLLKLIGEETKNGFKEMNNKLKERVERIENS